MGTPHSDEKYMERAIQLAKLGKGRVSPNPLVGCVIVKNGRIVGEGYHQNYGEAHAEVNAVNSVANQKDLVGSVVYVTLEPCSHHGKTPPCSDMLITKKVGAVKIACLDPNPKVSGNGKRKLESVGIHVEVGLLDKESRFMNRRFLRFYEDKRPYIILKWAETKDGYIARKNFDSKWISNSHSRKIVHKWRAEEDAILVGKNTALYDNPRLNVRDWEGNNPTRIVIDHNLDVPGDYHPLDGTIPTMIFNNKKTASNENIDWVQIERDDPLRGVLHEMWKRRIQSVIIEGGANTIQQFIEEDLWDEARVFHSAIEFGDGIEGPKLSGNLLRETDVNGDNLKIIQNG